MRNITQLSTAATSYFTVLKRGPNFDVTLVTPLPGTSLKTCLCRFSHRETAINFGKERAAQAMRPFKLRGVVA